MLVESNTGEWDMLGHGARGVDGATHKPPNHDSVSPPPTKTTPTTPTPTPPSPTPCATCWALSACSDLIPTHQLAEGLYQTPLCTAHARNLVYTAARGQGRRFMLTHPGFNLPQPPPFIAFLSRGRSEWNTTGAVTACSTRGNVLLLHPDKLRAIFGALGSLRRTGSNMACAQ